MLTDSQIAATHAQSPIASNIKIIPFAETIAISTYDNRHQFIRVATVLLDNDITPSGKKRRNTVIKFAPAIAQDAFKEKTEWLYIFTINGQIVKIGGTRTGLAERAGSYLCGHHVAARKKSGKCSVTNAFIYNTFEFYLHLGFNIEMFGYKLPKKEVEITIFGKTTLAVVQTYNIYEAQYIEAHKTTYGFAPFMSKNADPAHRS